MVKTREAGSAANRAIYLAIGVNTEGQMEVLGPWTAPTEGAKFWLSVVTELKNRGVQDILIACVDGLKGFPEAIEAVYPACKQGSGLLLLHLMFMLFLKYFDKYDNKRPDPICFLNRGQRTVIIHGVMRRMLAENVTE